MKIQNIFQGEVVTDPAKLQQVLDLSMNDNCMINAEMTFSEDVKNRAEHAGYQLPMVMMSVKMSRIDKHNLTDFIQRLAYMDAAGTTPIALPKGIDDLVVLHGKMSAWVELGWEIETDLTHMERPDFVEYTEFRVTQQVLVEVRNVRASIYKELEDKLPSQAVKELT